MHDTIRTARQAFEISGRGCIIAALEAKPRYTNVNELAERLFTSRPT